MYRQGMADSEPARHTQARPLHHTNARLLYFDTCAPVSDDEHCLANRYVLRTFRHQNGSNISVFLRLPAYGSLVCINIADEVAGRDLRSRWAHERLVASAGWRM